MNHERRSVNGSSDLELPVYGRPSTIYKLFYDPEQMRDLFNDTTHCRGIRTLNRLVELGDAKALYYRFLLFRITDRAAVVLDLDIPAIRIFRFLCHDLYSESRAFRREPFLPESRLKALLLH